MAKPKRPVDPYHVMGNEGYPIRSCSSLREAREAVTHKDAEWPGDAPHRIYALVTLEERTVIRAAMRYVDGLGTDSVTLLLRKNTPLERLVKAVEAARGK